MLLLLYPKQLMTEPDRSSYQVRMTQLLID